MSDLISRQTAIDAVRAFYDEYVVYDNGRSIEEILSELPSAQSERKKGKWIPQFDKWGDYVTTTEGYKCSECGEFDSTKDNFCPNCGAEME